MAAPTPSPTTSFASMESSRSRPDLISLDETLPQFARWTVVVPDIFDDLFHRRPLSTTALHRGCTGFPADALWWEIASLAAASPIAAFNRRCSSLAHFSLDCAPMVAFETTSAVRWSVVIMAAAVKVEVLEVLRWAVSTTASVRRAAHRTTPLFSSATRPLRGSSAIAGLDRGVSTEVCVYLSQQFNFFIFILILFRWSRLPLPGARQSQPLLGQLLDCLAAFVKRWCFKHSLNWFQIRSLYLLILYKPESVIVYLIMMRQSPNTVVQIAQHFCLFDCQ
mgnify:CR=1 FL=1